MAKSSSFWTRLSVGQTTPPFATDSLVQKDELLATFYAPEIYSAMRTYIYGLRSLGLPRSGRETKEQVEVADANIENYRNALRNLGMTEYQLDEILRTRQTGDQVEIRSPAAGFILVRNLTPGERFQKGTELYRIADLSKVWIWVATYETEAAFFKPGMPVQVSAPNLKKTFPARVAPVPPRFDPGSRTLKVRLEADNPGFLLRPDMFVDVELPIALPPAITVPADAFLDSGLEKTVFVDRGNGYLRAPAGGDGVADGQPGRDRQRAEARRADRNLGELPHRLGEQDGAGRPGDAHPSQQGPGMRPGYFSEEG